MTKAEVMIVAALLTAAAMPGDTAGANLGPDPTYQLQQTRDRNRQVWETFRIFYAAVSGASVDETSWKSPGTTQAPATGGTALPVTTPAK